MTVIKRVLPGAIELSSNGGEGVKLILQRYDDEDGDLRELFHKFPFQNGLNDEQINAVKLGRSLRGQAVIEQEEETNLRRYIPTSEIAIPVNASLVAAGWPPLDAAQIAHIEAIRIVSCGGTTDLPAKIAAGVGGALKDLMGKVAQRQSEDMVALAERTQVAEAAAASEADLRAQDQANLEAVTAAATQAQANEFQQQRSVLETQIAELQRQLSVQLQQQIAPAPEA